MGSVTSSDLCYVSENVTFWGIMFNSLLFPIQKGDAPGPSSSSGATSAMPDLQATLAAAAGSGVIGGGTDDSKRKHECLECGKRFPTPSKLQRHSFIHTGEKPYNCNYCPKSYSQLVHLKNHLMSHEKEFAAAAAAQVAQAGQEPGDDEAIEIPDHFEEGEVAPADL